MIKRDKSLLAMSLGIVISSQGMTTISDADSLSTNIDNYQAQRSGNQSDPMQNNNHNMGGNSSRIYTVGDDVFNSNKVTLSNPNAIGSGTVTESYLNVRSIPSTSSQLVGTLAYNERVDILEKSNGWYKIDFRGTQGYVASSYLKLNPIEKGIDVSKWNGNIDWNKVKNSGVDYVIIRGGFGTSTVDSKFKTYIEGASNAGLKVGVYWFSYATTPEKAVQEARKCLQTISPYRNSITYPVFFDYEYDSVKYANSNDVLITKNSATQIANSFINTIKAYGYDTGIYTNKNFSSTYFTDELINSTNLWVAQYNTTNTFNNTYSMWQYSEKGVVPGISSYVDLNYTYLRTPKNNIRTYSNSSVQTQSSAGNLSATKKGVTTVNLNLRKDLSASPSIINTIPANTTIEVLEQLSSGWYKVKYKHFVGYVAGNYVNM